MAVLEVTSEHGAMLRDSVADFVARATDLARVRRLRAEGRDCDRAIWQQMAELGWLGVLVPEACGGLGLTLAEAAIVAEGLGGALVPEPYTAVSVLAVTALVHADESATREQLLADIAAGRTLPAVAWQARAGDIETLCDGVTAGAFEGGWRLDGVKRYVVVGCDADGYLVSAQAADGAVLAWVPRQTAGATVTGEPWADGRMAGTVSFDGVAVTREQVVARGARAEAALRIARDHAALIASAELVGVMDRVLELSLDYMRTRVQFGKPIGSFQALQHRAVDLYVQRQLAGAVLEDGLRRVAGANEAERAALASRVKARCADAGLRIAREAIQIHGAIGFTDDYDAGLYLKRALVLSAWLGNAGQHRRRYARLALAAEV